MVFSLIEEGTTDNDIKKPLRFIKNDINHFPSLHNPCHLFGLFDIFCQKKYKGFAVLYVYYFS